MRERKFRAWLKEKKKMVDVIQLNVEHNFITYKEYVDDEIGYDDFHIDFDEIELMDYIGIPDKKKKEIYEGDIVAYNTCGTIINTFVQYVGGAFELVFIEDIEESEIISLCSSSELEVIGNIYDNPELLER